MPTFRLPMPPHGVNHATMPMPGGRRYKTPEQTGWERDASILLGGWVSPARTPLAVQVILEVPRKLLRRIDADKWAPVLIDLVIGGRCDQWIDELHVRKTPGDGWAEITVEEMK